MSNTYGAKIVLTCDRTSCSEDLNVHGHFFSHAFWPLKSLIAKESFQSPLYFLVPETVDEGVQHGCDHSVHH